MVRDVGVLTSQQMHGAEKVHIINLAWPVFSQDDTSLRRA